MNVIIDRTNWHSISISDTFLPTQPHCRVSSGRSVSKCEQRGTWSEAPPIERDGRSSCLGFTCTNLFMFIISPEQQTDWRACVGWYPTRERSHSRSVLNLSSDSHHHQYTPCVNISGIEQELLCTAEFKLRPRRSTLVFNRWRVVHYGQFSTYRSPWNINRPRVR